MKIEHIAIWVKDLEIMREFYLEQLNMSCSEKYVNKMKNFSSYFLSLDDGARLELMHRPDIKDHNGDKGVINGFTHLAISVGSKENVNRLTESIRNAGFVVSGEPRITGDGYYESVILDPEGNLIEITE